MSAKPGNQATYEEQLSALESRLKVEQHDEAMLGDVGSAMRKLLARNGGSEAHIRQILERQFDQGNLRRESYELVEKLLSKIVAEGVPAAPPAPAAKYTYVDTTVLDQPESATKQKAVSNQLQVGSILRDRYLLKNQVAEGSMGTVYKALDRRLAETGDANPFVAIKVLSPKLSRNGTALRALQQEAAKGRCLAHPNIVRFIDLDREDDLFFIVMEWLEGRSLARILDDNRGSTLDLGTAMDIVRQTARALSYAHQRGVIHADIKPGNVMITPDGHVKLIDFGVARVRQKENEGKSRFDPNVMRAGSPAYSSMQVLTGEDPVPADDVFSLACLMYRLVAGYRVFGPRNAADAAQEGMEPQQPQELSDQQWAILKKALSYSRVTRYQTPKAFMDAFSGPGGQRAPRSRQKPAPAPVTTAAGPEKAPQPVATAPMKVQTGSLQIGADETTQISVDSPMTAGRDSIMFEREDEPPRRSPLRLLVVGIILVASAAVVLRPELVEEFGLDEQIESISGLVSDLSSPPDAPREGAPPQASEFEDLEALPEVDVADTTAMDSEENVVEELVIDATGGSVDAVETAGPVDRDTDATADTATDAPEPDPLPPPIDFSQLPEPALLLELRGANNPAVPADSLIVREDSGAAIIDLVRTGDLAESLEVILVETRTSSSQDSIASGRYEIENEGLLRFDPGQPRARIRLEMTSNATREPDGDVEIAVRAVGLPDEDLASIRVTLEDDDQRAFEAGMPPNTIGFTVNELVVQEFDPAVQVDIVRYRADNTAIEVPYDLVDVTATEGQDYFAPGMPVLYFGPGQRSARILIPLGQDARTEQDELFRLELDAPEPPANSNIYTQIAVMIRDDDS